MGDYLEKSNDFKDLGFIGIRPLTTGLDNRTGGSGADTFDGSLGGTGGNLQTLGSSDSLDGGLGNDTLSATLTGGTTNPTLTSIETVSVTATGAATLDLLNVTGATTLESNNSTAALTFTNIGNASTALKVTNTNQNATFTYTTAAVAGTADVASLALYNVTGGTVTANGIETLNVTSTGAANTVTLSNTALTTLNVSGTQDLTLGTVGSTVTKIDGSGLTTGRLSVTAANATAATLIGGGSNDTMTGAAGNDNISGGDGNDSLSGAAGNDVIAGGNGNDTLTGGANNDNISGGDGNDTLSFADVTELSGDGTVAGGAGTDTLRFTGDVGADIVESTLVNSRVSSIEAISLQGVNAAARTVTLTDAAMTAMGTTTFTVTDGTYTDTGANSIRVSASALTAANSIDAALNNRATVAIRVTTGANNTDTVAIAVGGTTYATYTAAANSTAAQTAAGIAAAINNTAAGTYVATVLNTDFVSISAATSGTSISGSVTATSTGAVRIDGQGAAGAVTAGVVTPNNSYVGGAGNDTFRVGNVGVGTSARGIDANDTVTGGAGTDTLIVTGGATTATTVDMTNVSTVENITTSGTGAVTINAFAAGSIASTGTLTIDATSMTNAALVLTLDASNYTGTGKISVTAGAGADVLTGGAGSDTITSGAGNDVVTAGSGNDLVSLGDGDDTATYASEAAFSDDTGTTLVRDTVDGGAGNDILQFTTAAATLSAAQLAGATGFEIIDLAITGSSVTLTDAVVDANGGDVQQVRVTDAGTVTASALTAPNAVAVRVENAVGSGIVSVTGGAGNDSVTFSGATNGVLSATDAVKLGAGTDTIFVTNVAGHAAGTGAASSATLSSLVTGVESLVISDLATDQAAGDVTIALDNSFTATTFTIDGSQLDAGEDLTVTVATNATTASTTTAVSVIGGAGADTLNGDLKADTLIGGDGADVLEGEAGIDSLSGGNGDDVFVVNTLGDFAGLTAVETVSGGAGNDTLRLSATGTYNSSDLLGMSSVETVNLNSAGNAVLNLADSVFTSNGAATLAVTISDTAGNSTVNAAAVSATNSITVTTNNTAASDDSLVGGAGNDTFTATIGTGDLDAADTISGGAGSDTLVLSIRATGQTVTLTNVTGVETIRTAVGTGGAATNTITLGAIADTLVAAGTTLTMNFSDRTGSVVMNATNNEADGTFSITTGSAADTIYGGALADTIDAGGGADTITAGAGADSVVGNAGDDTIVGGAGADTLTGGSGSDVFTYTAVSESSGSNIDTITDFVTADDQLRVTLNYSTLGSGVTVNAVRAAAGQAGLTDAQAALSGERGQYVYDTTNGRLYVNVNADNLITSLDYSIAINAASTAANTIATSDIDFTITGTALGDTIAADGGADTIDGAGGADSITGGAGADSITGGTGADTIVGGDGADTIVTGSGIDVIRYLSTTVAALSTEAGDTLSSYAGLNATNTTMLNFATGLLVNGNANKLIAVTGAGTIGADDVVLVASDAIAGANDMRTAAGALAAFNASFTTQTNLAAGDRVLFVASGTGGGTANSYAWLVTKGAGALAAGDLTYVAQFSGIADATAAVFGANGMTLVGIAAAAANTDIFTIG